MVSPPGGYPGGVFFCPIPPPASGPLSVAHPVPPRVPSATGDKLPAKRFPPINSRRHDRFGTLWAERFKSGKVLIDKEKIKEVLAQGGELSLAEVLRLRVRHLSDGVAIGTKDFVNEVFTLHREKFGPKRKDGARPIRALACIGLTALRDLRVRAFG